MIHKNAGKCVVFVVTVFLICMCKKSSVLAQDYIEIDKFLYDNDLYTGNGFGDYVEAIKSEGKINLTALTGQVKIYIKQQLNRYKNYMLTILGMSLLCGMSISFFKGTMLGKMAEGTFTITYMVIGVVLVSLFSDVYVVTVDTIALIRDFMKTVIPVFAGMVAFSTGSFSATGYATLSMAILTAVNIIIIAVVVPLSRVYMVINITGNFMDDNRFVRLTKFVEKLAFFIVSSLLVLVVTLSVFQKMILPYKDMTARQTLFGTLQAIPMAGNTVSQISDLLFSSSMLVKNAIGLSALILILIMLLSPIIRIFLSMLLIQFIAAIIAPVSDSRIAELVEGVAKAIGILGMSLMTCAGLFMITLALTCT